MAMLHCEQTKPTLVKMAAEMRGLLAGVERGYVHRLLFGGLHLALERNGRQWRMAIARERRIPSVREREVVARDFNLPVGVEWTVTERAARGRKFRPGAKLWVAECRWREE